MNYSPSVQVLQQHFQSILPLSPAQIARLSILCVGIFLAKKIHLTFIARVLPHENQQDSRVRWISRLLVAPFMRIDFVYHPLLKATLEGFNPETWHLAIDRTPWIEKELDLLMVSLSYRKRAIPLVWCEVPYGGAPLAVAVHLLEQCRDLLPANAHIILHGDKEFGGREVIRSLRHWQWDFILGQNSGTTVWLPDASSGVPFKSLSIPKRGLRAANISLFKDRTVSGLNLIAFRHKRRDKSHRIIHETLYLVTSLPLSHHVKQLGKRRWGSEPLHKDLKSAGLELTDTQIRSPRRRQGLLIMFAVVYLLNVTLGRYLCQIGQRRKVDSQPRRHLSLFRIGWDYIVNKIVKNDVFPVPLSLSP
jgi:hypothetical protein